ncbi:hypothetical protein KQX54_003716 [Cotesia glomerata]|uniref:C2H2-type domain-containing protein n=1 Tax=Cotesia glomerata TaxID=32391 RepID=A0AAV7IPI5_COTGL|nr:hypothetical protein KQX54_003716 [Cotesia glomerata]
MITDEGLKFPCPKCGNMYSKTYHWKHVNYDCGVLPQLRCPHCPYAAKHTSNVKRHIRRIHPGSQVLAGKAEVPMRPMRKCLQPERQPMLPQEICLQPIAEVLLPLLRLSVPPCVQYACACPQEASWNKSLRRRHF